MSSDWKAFSLGEVYEYCSGLSKPRSEFGSGHPFLGFKDVFYNSAVPKILNQLVRSTPQEQNRCSVKRGDLFLTRTSETMDELGMSSVALKDYPYATFNGFTKRLRPKSSDVIAPEYARYYFRSKRFRQDVNAMSTMSTRASLNNEMLDRLQVVLPSLEEQKCIGFLLGTLDDKIELNRKTNETLEAMAKALFKSWFVDFDPVRAKAEGRPTGLPVEISDLFPDSFEESELGEIPRGWRVKSLDEIAHFLNGLALQKYPPEDGAPTLPVIKIAQLKKGDSTGADRCSTAVPSDYVVRDGDVLFSWSGSLAVDIWCGCDGALNQHLFKVTSKAYSKWFYYQWIMQHLPDFQEIAQGKATTMGHIQRHHLNEAKALTPTLSLLTAMDSVFTALLDRVFELRKQSRVLATTRDVLLPKLISGELRIPDAEQLVEAAGL
jgi:type I restriction enzyme S subunit